MVADSDVEALWRTLLLVDTPPRCAAKEQSTSTLARRSVGREPHGNASLDPAEPQGPGAAGWRWLEENGELPALHVNVKSTRAWIGLEPKDIEDLIDGVGSHGRLNNIVIEAFFSTLMPEPTHAVADAKVSTCLSL
jgi:hypothetical protein